MDNYNIYKKYTLDKINNSLTIEQPFYHVFIQDILHKDLYILLKDKNEYYKQFTSNRLQDNKSFVNNKYSIIGSNDVVLQIFHKLFSDKEIITAIFNKFFINTLDYLNKISVYEHM
uniref:Uncharacterized protein n=1 Tax=viral metagenome TaxID=1070528 RepID=A0A6C0E054_9ZZZZ